MDNSSEIGKELDKAGEVIKALQLYDQYAPPVNLLYKEFIGKTHIEKHELEDFVVEKIVRGHSLASIAKELDNRVPNKLSHRTWVEDIQKFMERSDILLTYFERDRTALAKRHIDAKAKVEEELAELIVFTKRLLIESKNRGELQNSIAAANALSKIYNQYNQLVGFAAPKVSAPAVQTNVLINLSEQKFETLRDKANKADFKIVDVDMINKDDGKI